MHLRSRHGSNLTQFVSEEIPRPVTNIADQIDIQWQKVGTLVAVLAEIERNLIPADLFFSNAPLESPQKMFAVAFQEDLDASDLDGINEDIR